MKIIEVIADESYVDSIKNIADKNDASDFWIVSSEGKERKVVRILVKPEQRQIILDALQGILSTSFSYRVVVIPIEAALPREEAEEEIWKTVRTLRDYFKFTLNQIKDLVSFEDKDQLVAARHKEIWRTNCESAFLTEVPPPQPPLPAPQTPPAAPASSTETADPPRLMQTG